MARKHTGEFHPRRQLQLTDDCKVAFRPALIAVTLVSGHEADRIGGYHLQKLANHRNMPVVVQPPSKFHEEKIVHPEIGRKRSKIMTDAQIIAAHRGS